MQELFTLQLQARRGSLSACRDADRNLILIEKSFRKDINARMTQLQTQLSAIEKNVSNMSPEKVLQRGFSITSLNGKAVKNGADVQKGDVVYTRLANGELKSRIE
jgi:exodeoxyribonuclease VII large subunit